MSLPSKLLFNNKINFSCARNFNSTIQTQNTSNYGLGQTAIFNIAAMKNKFHQMLIRFITRLRIRNTLGSANTAF